jgi:hypothetical protein
MLPFPLGNSIPGSNSVLFQQLVNVSKKINIGSCKTIIFPQHYSAFEAYKIKTLKTLIFVVVIPPHQNDRVPVLILEQ